MASTQILLLGGQLIRSWHTASSRDWRLLAAPCVCLCTSQECSKIRFEHHQMVAQGLVLLFIVPSAGVYMQSPCVRSVSPVLSLVQLVIR